MDNKVNLNFFFFLLLFFLKGSYPLAQGMLASNSRYSSCLSLLSVKITGLSHHAWLLYFVSIYKFAIYTDDSYYRAICAINYSCPKYIQKWVLKYYNSEGCSSSLWDPSAAGDRFLMFGRYSSNKPLWPYTLWPQLSDQFSETLSSKLILDGSLGDGSMEGCWAQVNRIPPLLHPLFFWDPEGVTPFVVDISNHLFPTIIWCFRNYKFISFCEKENNTV